MFDRDDRFDHIDDMLGSALAHARKLAEEDPDPEERRRRLERIERHEQQERLAMIDRRTPHGEA